jgi:hypothetical protein
MLRILAIRKIQYSFLLYSLKIENFYNLVFNYLVDLFVNDKLLTHDQFWLQVEGSSPQVAPPSYGRAQA